MKTSFDYIELNRTFSLISAGQKNESSLSNIESDPFGWDELLKEHRIIILAESGAGKTTELKHKAQEIAEEGHPAFFIRLENIVDYLNLAFEIGDETGFYKWLSSNQEGWLFLDSVDEALQTSSRGFELGLRRLADLLNLALQRTHLYITGRTSVWRQADLQLCKEQLPFHVASSSDEDEDEDETHHNFKLVTLNDLDQLQIHRFLSRYDPQNHQALEKAIEKANAHEYTSRPQDLIWLVDYWKKNQSLGTRKELIENNIQQRLIEIRRPGPEGSLPLATAREGARKLAATLLLTKKASICLPGQKVTANGLSISEILDDWSENQQNLLLTLPIFDEAEYGAVRFHHVTVKEYLAAEWVIERMQQTPTERRLMNLFFSHRYNRDIIIPVMRPVLPWIALQSTPVRKQLLEIDPEVFFEGGDPAYIDAEERKAILDKLCQHVATGRRIHLPKVVIPSFASNLGEQINELLEKYKDESDVLFELLILVNTARLKLPEDFLLTLMRRADTSEYNRLFAIRIFISSGGNKALDRLLSQLEQEPQLNRKHIAEILQSIDATPDNIQWLARNLRKLEKREYRFIDYFDDAFITFVKKAEGKILTPLLMQLPKLLQNDDKHERGINKWLYPLAQGVIERIIAGGEDALQESVLPGILFDFLKDPLLISSQTNKFKETVFRLLESHEGIRRGLCWYAYSQEEASNKTNARYVLYHVRSFLHNEGDFVHFTDLITSSKTSDEKQRALKIAFPIYLNIGEKPEYLAELRKVTTEDGINETLEQWLDVMEKDRKERKKQDEYYERLARAEEKRQENEDNEKRLVEAIKAAPKKLHSEYLDQGIVPSWQCYLFRKCDRDGNRLTSSNWEDLIDEFGIAVAESYRDSAIYFWRKYTPVKSEDSSIPLALRFGLSGIQMEADITNDWTDELSEDDVLLACRYASHELNGFPPWFETLCLKRSELVSLYIEEEVREELNEYLKKGQRAIGLIDRLKVYAEWGWEIFAPLLLKIIEEIEPPTIDQLEQILAILQSAKCISNNELAQLASAKIKSVPTTHLPYWFSVWTGVSPEEAVDEMKRLYVEKISPRCVSLAMTYIVQLRGGRIGRTSHARKAYLKANVLHELYKLMSQLIRPEDDINRPSGSIYSPSLRDEAEGARDSLINALVELEDSMAVFALMEIAEQSDKQLKEWIERKIKQKAEQAAEKTLDLAGVNHFSLHIAYQPSNSNELSDMVHDLLQDFKDEYEDGDKSIADLFRDKNEEELRRVLANWLEKTSQSFFIIVEEEELADEKRIDIRLYHQTDVRVVLELKVVDNWSGPDLLKQLEDQLCGDYMLDGRSKHGFYVLFFMDRGKRKRWQINRKKCDFEKLPSEIQKEWDENISHRFKGITVRVVGIDMTKRGR